jgi:hypothetical protein
MKLIDHILKLVKNPSNKSLLQVGAHDDTFTKKLAKHFKNVYLYSEFIKIPEYKKVNIDIKKVSYEDLLNRLSEFDILYMDNEFHHLPDIHQMWTYHKLQPGQILIIKEWDTQQEDPYFKCFQDCRLLHQLTKEILLKFKKNGIIKVEEIYQKESYTYESKQEMIEFFRYVLPDHWEFGKTELFELLKDAKFPIKINEGYFLYKITKSK